MIDSMTVICYNLDVESFRFKHFISKTHKGLNRPFLHSEVIFYNKNKTDTYSSTCFRICSYYINWDFITDVTCGN